MTYSTSFGYKTTLMAPVPDAGTVVLYWPPDDANSGSVDTVNWELSVGNQIIPKTDANVTFDGVGYSIEIENVSGVEWAQAQDLYLYCPNAHPISENLTKVLSQHSATLADHETRIDALENP